MLSFAKSFLSAGVRTASCALSSVSRSVIPVNNFSQSLNILPSPSIVQQVRFNSTKRKRKIMMNKHKYEKRMKLLRNLTSKNLKSK